jgi:hypothetical protein
MSACLLRIIAWRCGLIIQLTARSLSSGRQFDQSRPDTPCLLFAGGGGGGGGGGGAGEGGHSGRAGSGDSTSGGSSVGTNGGDAGGAAAGGTAGAGAGAVAVAATNKATSSHEHRAGEQDQRERALLKILEDVDQRVFSALRCETDPRTWRSLKAAS